MKVFIKDSITLLLHGLRGYNRTLDHLQRVHSKVLGVLIVGARKCFSCNSIILLIFWWENGAGEGTRTPTPRGART